MDANTPVLKLATLLSGLWSKLLFLGRERHHWPVSEAGLGLPTSALVWADVVSDYQTRFLAGVAPEGARKPTEDKGSTLLDRALRHLEEAEVVLPVSEGDVR